MSLFPPYLTPVQIKIYQLRTNGYSYDRILEEIQHSDDPYIQYHIHGHDAITKSLKRTALGHTWPPTIKGGRLNYFCQEDRELFLTEIQQRADSLNCLITYEAFNLAVDLHNTRVIKATELLQAAHSHEMANSLYAKYYNRRPEKDYLRTVCSFVHVSIFSAQKISYFRRKYCSKSKIEKFFQKHFQSLNRSPLLIFNADETIVKSNKSFKVLAPHGTTPVSPQLPQLPHYSAMICVSAGGFKLKPMFICPHFINMPTDLMPFAEEALFVSNRSGWMTKRSFLLWTHFFIYSISIYKQTLPPELRNERFLLLLDGHSSRSTFEAIHLLDKSGVDVLVFPPHATHIIQPLDVSINSPLKIQFQKNIYQLAIDHGMFSLTGESNTSFTGTWRPISIESFLNAFDTSANRKNIKSAFRATGIVPLDSHIPLTSSLLSQSSEIPQLFHTNRFSISNKLLTTQERMIKIRDAGDLLFPINNNIEHSMFEQWNLLNSEKHCDGTILGGPEAFFWYENHPQPNNREISRIPTPFVQQMYTYRHNSIDHLRDLIEFIKEKDAIFLAEHIPHSKQVHQLLHSLSQPHLFCNGKTAHQERMTLLRQFNETINEKLVTTFSAINGYEFTKRVLIIYCFIPTKETQRRRRDETFIFLYKNNKELEQLSSLKLTTYELLL
jgi:hypothetical protein